jgi:hypothetical protein
MAVSSGMTRLPNAERAVLDLRKIEDYCLNPEHPHGRHKARVFRTVLGVGRADSQWLREAILEGVRSSEAIELITDEHGVRWRADVPITRQTNRISVRTLWIVKAGEDIPRFVTCWVH